MSKVNAMLKTAHAKSSPEEYREATTGDTTHTTKRSVSALEKMRKHVLPDDKRERSRKRKFLIDGVVAQGYHTIYYGGAGSGKTTLMLKMSQMMVQSHPQLLVLFIYLDGQHDMADTFMSHIEEQSLQDKLFIITECNAEEALQQARDVVDEIDEPENVVLVIDTFKYITKDILNKNSNRDAMKSIRHDFVNKGATVLSLHHTNKDGETFSGTAEIEQDSDGLIRVDTVNDPDNEGCKISTLIEGGRCRFHVKPKSFRFEAGKPQSAVMLAEAVDVSHLKEQKRDEEHIAAVKDIIKHHDGEIGKTALVDLMCEHDGINLSVRECKAFLDRYATHEWSITVGGERNHIHYYTLLE